MNAQVQGPKLYFLSIEKKYAQPIDFWMTELECVRTDKHMEQVNFLKYTYGVGHGHANAVVSVFRAKNNL